MEKLVMIGSIMLMSVNVFCQSALEIIKGVIKAQQNLKTISYTLIRTDTLVTGDVRTMTGKSKILVDKEDNVFGFKFWSKKDNDFQERIYDGYIGYEVNVKDKSYTLTTNPNDFFLVNGGGQIILQDVVKLDTSQAIDFKASENTGFFYLTMIYEDLKEYHVIRRYKEVKINKENMLPVSVRKHQETLNKIQDLYFKIKEININDISFNYDFSSSNFLKEFKQQNIISVNSPVINLKDKSAPGFNLVSFNNDTVSLSKLHGKVILLDFWEVWCGPCLESMPKIQILYETFKDQGLEVYGITNEIKQLESSKLLIKKRGISFPILIGNEQLKKNYKINAIPLYIIIDKKGKIIFAGEGYSNKIENAIKTALPGKPGRSEGR